MNIVLESDQEIAVLGELKDRLEKGLICEVSISGGSFYCTYTSPSGTKVEYVMSKRSGKTVLGVTVNGDSAQIVENDSNATPIDLAKRWMERILKNPNKKDSTARFLSHTT